MRPRKLSARLDALEQKVFGKVCDLEDEVQIEADARAKAEADAEAQVKADAKAQAKAEAEAQAKVEADAQADADDRSHKKPSKSAPAHKRGR